MFYEFRQNNSGGVFDVDHSKGISVLVIIEADSVDQANNRAEEIGLYFDGCDKGYDCECCGDRWYTAWGSDGSSNPEYYGRSIINGVIEQDDSSSWGSLKWADGPEGYIHYADGTVAPFDYAT